MATAEVTEIRKAKICFEGSDNAVYMTKILIGVSWWFAVTPLPDDYWEIEVKREHIGLTHKMARDAGIKINEKT